MASLVNILAAGVLLVGSVATAADADDAARQEMQRALNKEVMASPFNPGDIKKAESYAAEAKRNNVVPVQQAPGYWLPGWTCSNISAYAYYNYGAYRDCVYYHHYYGHYWR